MEYPVYTNMKCLVCQHWFILMFYLHQEEEKRIASVMARKEEEKKKEISKLAVLKVVFFSVNFPYSL